MAAPQPRHRLRVVGIYVEQENRLTQGSALFWSGGSVNGSEHLAEATTASFGTFLELSFRHVVS